MVASLMVIAIVAGIGAGYLAGVNVSGNRTNRNTATTCEILAPTIGVSLRAMAIYGYNSVAPAPGAMVNGEWVDYCNAQRQATSFGPSHTNDTGWVDLFHGGGGIYILNVSLPDNPLTVQFSIPTHPGEITYALVNLSTGDETIQFCGLEGPCP